MKTNITIEMTDEEYEAYKELKKDVTDVESFLKRAGYKMAYTDRTMFSTRYIYEKEGYNNVIVVKNL